MQGCSATAPQASRAAARAPRVAMLLDNAFRPDPRVANEARALAEAGFHVAIHAWDREGERPPRETWHGVEVRRLGPRSRHGLGSRQMIYLAVFWWHCFWQLIGREVDAIHCHDFNTLPLGWLLAALKRCRLVYDAHESYADMLAANVAPWIKAAIVGAERLLCRRTDAALTVGALLEAELQRRGARHTWVVGNWKRLDEFAFEPAAVAGRRRELGLNGAAGASPLRLWVTYIGWLNADRGIVPLLEAVEAQDGIALLVGGDGPSADEVRAAAGRCERIRYLGFVNPADIPLYTAMADVIYYGLDSSNVNASYSAPNKLFEALAAGRAIVCNRIGEVGRIVAEEGCGQVVGELSREALADALGQLGDADRLAACQAAAREAGEQRYNWARAAEQLLALYQAIGLEGQVSSVKWQVAEQEEGGA